MKTLPSFIRSVGIDKSAKLFKVPERQVRAWLYSERLPRPAKGLFIERVTARHPAGPVRFVDIYSPRPERKARRQVTRAAAAA